MKNYIKLLTIFCMIFFAGIFVLNQKPVFAASAKELSHESQAAINQLIAKSPTAKALSSSAVAILVFPSITKAGFIVGGQYGEGALFKNGKIVGYYNTVAGSWGLQAGVQKFGYALFFMNESALKWLDKSDGWELGVGPSIVVVDEGAAGSFTTTTAQSDVNAFFFDQKGLMAGIGLQGTKVTKLDK